MLRKRRKKMDNPQEQPQEQPQAQESIDEVLKKLNQTGEKRQVTTSIYCDEDIRSFLFYRSKILKTPELSLEVQHLINNPICSLLNEENKIDTVITYDKALPPERLLLASWYSGDQETDAFRRTDERYIIAEKKPVHGIVCFRDPSVCQTDFAYIYVCGRFASPTEEYDPIFWAPVRLFCTSLRDLCLYIIPGEELKHLGIDLGE
jgi:hypothetical protein